MLQICRIDKNNKRKWELKIIKISKREAFALRERGYGDFVKHTYSKAKHYYLVEDRNVLKALNAYHKETIVHRV